MKITARVTNRRGEHSVRLKTGEHEHALTIAPKTEGEGSSVNGGELLFLALATCFCNDIYREARKRGLEVRSVEVTVEGAFGAEGEGAREIRYWADVDADAPHEDVLALMQHTDTVAEIHNTLRAGTPVILTESRQGGTF